MQEATKYIRMSTERQHYSFSNQNEVIDKFADRRRFEVIKTYSDPAKTGVSFRKRRKGTSIDEFIQL